MAGQNVIVASSISPQAILSQQLAASEAALYTVPAATSVKVAQGTICNVTSLTAAPTLTLGTTGTGGTFGAGTYYWKVTAVSASGETLGSNEVSAALGANATQPLTFTDVPGRVTFRVYRGTAAGQENTLVATVATTSYTDTGSAGTTGTTPPAASTYAYPVSVYLSVVKSGGTIGDGTHRVLNNYTLAGNDTLPLKDILGGAMLGPGDFLAGYASAGSAVDIVVTGTVHA